MGTVGDLVAKLFCDNSNFDKNIKKSQKEVQEFKRKTEQTAAKVNNSFNSMGSAVGKVNPQLGSLIGSLGRVSVVAAAGTAAFEGFKQIIQQSETAMDDLEKKTAQLNGAWEHFTTTISNGNIFSGITSSLKEAVRLAGELAEIIDNLGTFGGYHNLNKTEVENNLSHLKELYRSGASKEEINKQIEKTKASIVRSDITSGKIVDNLKLEYDKLLEAYYNDVKRSGHVGKSGGTYFLDKFSTDTKWRDSIVSWSNYLNKFTNFFGKHSESAISPLKNNKEFVKFLKKGHLYDDYLFKAFQRGEKEGYEYIKDVISIVTGAVKKKENSEHGIVALQKTKTAWLNEEKERSDTHNDYYKQLNTITNKSENTNKSEKPGKGGSIYTSKQEAPKERTLQAILDDLDKSLAWNKYLAQNLGEDITGANLSTLEKTANELKDLLKNTTDEEQRNEIIKVIKSLNDRAGLIAVNSNKKPAPGKKDKEEDYLKAYDVKSAFYDFKAIASEKRVYSIENEINSGEKGKPLLNNMIEEFKKRGLTIKFDVESLSDETLLKASKWNAENFFKANGSYTMDTSVKREGMDEKEKLKELNIELGKFKDALQVVIAKARNSYIARRGTRIASNYVELDYSNLRPAYNYLDTKLRSNIPGSGVNSSIYGGDVLSATYLSNLDAVKRKYTGFGDFQNSFNNYAIENFLRERQENNNFDTSDILGLIFDAYKKALADNPDVPNYYKSIDDLIKENPLYDEQHPHKELSEKVKKIINYKNLSLLALEDLKDIDKTYTSLEINGSEVSGGKASKLKSKLLDHSKYIKELLKDAEVDNVYTREEIINKILGSLSNLRTNRISEFKKIYSEEEEIDSKTQLLDKIKKIREALILLIKEKEKNITDEELKRLNELRNDNEVGDIIKGYEKQTVDSINSSIADYDNKSQVLTTDLENFNEHKKKLEDEVNNIDKAIKNAEGAKEDNDKLIEKAKRYKELTNSMYAISDAAAQIGTAFSSLDSKFGDVAGSIFNIIGITAEAIGKILGMATAEGTLSAMKLPWPKNLAAVATVIAAGASIAGQVKGMTSRKYATGGIVSGPGTGISDSIPIRVSNGEMILNHRQQGNLFNLLDKGGSNSKLSSGEVEFKISGSSLVGVLRNYNNINNKIR